MVVRPLWPREGISHIPFWVYTDPEIYASEHEHILGWRDDWLEVRVNHAVFETLRDELTSVFSVGRSHDRVVGVGGSLKFREQLVIFDSELTPQFTGLSAVTMPTALHEQSQSLTEVHDGGYQIADHVPTTLRTRKSLRQCRPL
jgi:hypothetical protein